MDINIWSPSVLAIIVGFLVTVGVLVFGKKMTAKSRKTTGWIFGVVGVAGLIVLVVGASLPASLQFLNNPLWGGFGKTTTIGGTNIIYSQTPINQNANPTVLSSCSVDTTTVKLSGVDPYSNLAVGGNHRYKINNGVATVIADAGTFTASPGNTLQVLWENASTTGYYSESDSYTVPCKGTFEPGEKDANGNVIGAKKLSQNGSLTVTFFNDPNSDAIDGATTNQTLVAGDKKNLKMSVQGQYQKDFPYGFTVVVEYNKTNMDDVILSVRDGSELSKASLPQSFSSTYGTESATKVYSVPAIFSNAEYLYTVMIDADDTLNPASGGTADVKLTFFANNLFVNDKNGGAYEGPSVEDEDNSVTRSGQVLATLYTQ